MEISFYATQCAKENWSVRELRQQRNSMLFHRLALSKDKEGIIALATEGQEVQRAEDVVKDPCNKNKTFNISKFDIRLCNIY